MPVFTRPARVVVEEGGGGGLGLPVGLAAVAVAVIAVVLFVADHLPLLLAAGMAVFAGTAFVYRLLCRVPLVVRYEVPARPPMILRNEKAPEEPQAEMGELIPLPLPLPLGAEGERTAHGHVR